MDEFVKNLGSLRPTGRVVFVEGAGAPHAALPPAATLTKSFFAPKAAQALSFVGDAEDRFSVEPADAGSAEASAPSA